LRNRSLIKLEGLIMPKDKKEDEFDDDFEDSEEDTDEDSWDEE